MKLEKEDYLDPACPLCGRPGESESARPVPRDRIQRKLREYEDASDWNGAERHLLYWLSEAEMNGDRRGQLMLQNELMGFYRKQGDRERAEAHADQAENLIAALQMEDTVTAGTTHVNAGTVREAFGDPVGALDYFEKARENYERNLPENDGRLGGLYNNMALTCTALGQYEEAMELYEQALRIMADVPDGELEQAITYLNMANTVEAQLGLEKGEQRIGELTERAEELLEAKSEELLGREDALLSDSSAISALSREMRARLGYYAFVCEKCAPVFSYYGYFLAAERFADRSDRLTALL